MAVLELMHMVYISIKVTLYGVEIMKKMPYLSLM